MKATLPPATTARSAGCNGNACGFAAVVSSTCTTVSSAVPREPGGHPLAVRTNMFGHVVAPHDGAAAAKGSWFPVLAYAVTLPSAETEALKLVALAPVTGFTVRSRWVSRSSRRTSPAYWNATVLPSRDSASRTAVKFVASG